MAQGAWKATEASKPASPAAPLNWPRLDDPRPSAIISVGLASADQAGCLKNQFLIGAADQPVSKLVDRLMNAVETFVGEANYEDDLTCLAVKRET